MSNKSPDQMFPRGAKLTLRNGGTLVVAKVLGYDMDSALAYKVPCSGGYRNVTISVNNPGDYASVSIQWAYYTGHGIAFFKEIGNGPHPFDIVQVEYPEPETKLVPLTKTDVIAQGTKLCTDYHGDVYYVAPDPSNESYVIVTTSDSNKGENVDRYSLLFLRYTQCFLEVPVDE